LSDGDQETTMTKFKSRIAGPRGLPANVIRVLAVAGAAMTLAGCYTARETTASIPFDYRERHPISIREGDRSVEIFTGSNRGGLTPAQRGDVAAFARAWQREATSGVVIDLPAGTPNELASADALREVRSILAGYGIPAHGVRVRPYRPVDKSTLATIRLNYSKIMAQTGPCGLWPQDLGPGPDPVYRTNQPYWNLGCATQQNLAAMVENPADLVQPRGDGSAYTPRRTIMLDKYRKGENTAGTYPNEDKAKISDLGK
jgi:pilus assembly protein CpaD